MSISLDISAGRWTSSQTTRGAHYFSEYGGRQMIRVCSRSTRCTCPIEGLFSRGFKSVQRHFKYRGTVPLLLYPIVPRGPTPTMRPSSTLGGGDALTQEAVAGSPHEPTTSAAPCDDGSMRSEADVLLEAATSTPQERMQNDGTESSQDTASIGKRSSDRENDAELLSPSTTRRISDGAADGDATSVAKRTLGPIYPRDRDHAGGKSGPSGSAGKRRKGRAGDLLGEVPTTPSPSSFPPWSPRPWFRFEILHTSTKSRARVGRIHTPHGTIDTPGFVAVGTNAALKAVDTAWADTEGLQLMFANTYHLMLHPGADVVEAAGGLHAFMGRSRDRPIITDSGGFQVFSLAYGTVHEEVTQMKRASPKHARLRVAGSLVKRIDERGVEFASYRDGSRMTLTPEGSVAAQKSLGADIILPLDELPPYHIDDVKLEDSLDRSHRWMTRSLAAHLADPRQQAMYGIVHGGMRLDLRKKSIDYLAALPFDGFAIGGSLGKDREDARSLLSNILPWMPESKPIHVLGVADHASLPALVPLGADTFDSCYPTRVGRHGAMLTDDGPLRVISGLHRNAHRKAVEDCDCFTCTHHTLAYLHHLKKANEPLCATLLTIHNIHYMTKLMAKLRAKILADEI